MPTSRPSLAEAARRLGVEVKDMDETFGVVVVDPARGLYAAQVRSSKAQAHKQEADEYNGPWSNPAIAPFGPVKR
jgi:hypothetical protein